MKKLLAVSLFAFAAAFNSFCAPANPPPTSAEQLRSEFEAALKVGDTNAILSLYNWDGVSNGMKKMRDVAFHGLAEFLAKYPTNEMHTFVRLRPLRDGYEMESVSDGIRYRPNVSVAGMIQGTLSVDDHGTNTSWGMEIPYGEKNGGFYFAGATTEKIYEPKVKENLFEVDVGTTNLTESTAYVISFVYLQNDQEINKSFTGTNEFHKFVSGNELKSCVLRKISDDNNSLKLEIQEFSTNKLLTLVDSETSSTNTPIIYESKQP